MGKAVDNRGESVDERGFTGENPVEIVENSGRGGFLQISVEKQPESVENLVITGDECT
jgi:hypothetical protein